MKFKTKLIIIFAVLSCLFASTLIWVETVNEETQVAKFLHSEWFLLTSIVLLFALMFVSVMLLLWRYDQKMKMASEAKTRQLKYEMTNNIAHELKTPVSSIRGYLETLVSNPDIDEANKKLFLERSYKQSLRLSELINDVALITKMEEAPSQFARENVNLWKISEVVFEEFKAKLQQSEIAVENLLSQDLCIDGNSNLLYAIFRNLVENTIKYAGGPCTIHIEAHTHNQKIYITYYDTGKGVDEKQLPHLFDRFYRIQGQQGEGSGLGLAIVRNAVAFHGGWIQVFSHQPHGLQFEIAL